MILLPDGRLDIEELPAEAETKPVAQLSAGHDINGEILQLLEADYDEYAENPIDYVKQLIEMRRKTPSFSYGDISRNKVSA